MAERNPSQSSSPSLPGSPLLRSNSPSPSINPSLALGACPLLDRSASTPSTVSTASTRSVSVASDGSAAVVVRRRGYMRPQGTMFADSARNRDSVMSLGSIAHMQYYFARTGLLDGKGGHLARDKKKRAESQGEDAAVKVLDPESLSDYGASARDFEQSTSGETVYTDETWERNLDPSMLPPTVSTYKQKPNHLQPLPDMTILRRELKESLDDAQKLLQESKVATAAHSRTDRVLSPTDSPTLNDHGWHEVQGLHVLDIVTLAIRAAQTYYTYHNNSQKLYALKPEKDIRANLYQVLDILKRTANRGFRGGLREQEQQGILEWISGIQTLLDQEEAQESAERALRDQYEWLKGDWAGRERQRELAFLRSFDTEASDLPEWSAPDAESASPPRFLKELQSGLRLVHLHNELVKRSKRRFGQISKFHTDVAKPYRCAENLRFWIKAAELRWEVRLDLNVMDLVCEKDESVWVSFDRAVLKWASHVRDELSTE